MAKAQPGPKKSPRPPDFPTRINQTGWPKPVPPTHQGKCGCPTCRGK